MKFLKSCFGQSSPKRKFYRNQSLGNQTVLFSPKFNFDPKQTLNTNFTLSFGFFYNKFVNFYHFTFPNHSYPLQIQNTLPMTF